MAAWMMSAQQKHANGMAIAGLDRTMDGAMRNCTMRGRPASAWSGLLLRAAVARWVLLLPLVLLAAAMPASLKAQAFQPVHALTFTKTFEGSDPLPQVITLASTAANFNYSVTSTVTTGGTWLTLSRGTSCCYTTPDAVTVTVAPLVTLAAGTYTAQIVAKSQNGLATVTIPVSLTIIASTSPSFDDVAGALSFAMQTKGLVPPLQTLQIRNAGAGSLVWTAAATTADGGAWLTLSATTGTAPSLVNVGVVSTKLPGAGLVAGTFVGQINLATSGNTVSIPIAVTVGDSVFRQMNPLNFVKEYAGGNPLSQVITFASTNTNFNYYVGTANASGGSWLSISRGTGCCYVTPDAVTVTVNPDITLAAGTYSAEIIARSQTGSDSAVVPVTLVVAPSTAAFFDSLPGELAFSMATDGEAPPTQIVQIRNAGTGSLPWTASGTTADGGAWLTISATSGTAPSTINVGINPANLPGTGLTAGTFTGQVVLTGTEGRVTIPITVYVGAAVFRQVNPINFSKLYAGANPMPQVITLASTGANFNYYVSTVSSTGGNWLTISRGTGCCYTTPDAVTVTANPAVTLAAGTYTAEITAKSQSGNDAVTVPVTLSISPATVAFLDALPGELTFTMATGGAAPPTQSFQIRNAGAGALAWTASFDTSDGGKWLTVSPGSGTAPTFITVGITPANLPGGGLVAGTFTGETVILSAAGRVTIPVTVTVGANVFRQVNPLTFTKAYAGANPLPQVIPIVSTGTNFNYYVATASSTGGNWLTISRGTGCCYSTPDNITVSVNPAVTLAAGTYSAEVIAKSQAGDQSLVVPVTLVVAPASAPFFDSVPGAVTFSMAAGGTAPPAQSVQIRNAGAGTLDWTLGVTKSDGGAWLTASATTGTAPSTLSLSVVPANLPGKGLVAGVFTGQVTLQTGTDRVTIPVTVTVGPAVFVQPAPISFSKAYNGANPAAQVVNIASSGTNFSHYVSAATSTGGAWLTLSRGTGCCYSTPDAVTVTAAPATTLAAGVYTAEIIAVTQSGGEAMVIPVSLTVNGTAAAATPTFTPPGGSYSSTQSVTILDATIDAAIHYTVDGTTPTAASKIYTGPISVTATQTIKAIAIATGYAQSAVATAVYTLTAPIAATPLSTQTVSIAEATTGATVYYTTNGTIPTTASTKYTGPITFTTSAVLKFIAVAPGYTQSAVRTVTVTIQ